MKVQNKAQSTQFRTKPDSDVVVNVRIAESQTQSNFQNSQQPYAIIVGLDDERGVHAARTLARHNVPVIAIARDSKSYGSRTKVCEEILLANTGNEGLIRTLETLGPQLGRKAVLFPCMDTIVLVVSQHRQRLEEWYHVVLPEPDVVEMMMDKIAFYTYAQKEGFQIPRTFFLNSKADAEQAAEKLAFPCCLKPPSSKSPKWLQHTHLKAFKVSNPEELLTFYDHCSGWADTLIVQEWIEGTDADIHTCHCYFDANSQPVVTFTSRKLRQWPPETGQACLAEEYRNDLVLGEAVRLFRSVRFRGLGWVEFKRDERSGKYLIVEPNIGRLSGRMAIAEAGGVELLYTMYCDAVGWPLPANLKQKYEGVKWIHLRRDCQSALQLWRQGDLTLKAWWRTWRGRKAYALFSWHDPGPFWGDLQNATRLFLSPQERRKRAYRKSITWTSPEGSEMRQRGK